MSEPSAVFTRQGETWLPTVLSRGPWDPRAARRRALRNSRRCRPSAANACTSRACPKASPPMAPRWKLFAHADLSLHLHRQPIGEWIGLMAQTQMDGSGAGTALSRLFDEQGGFGVAVQTLALRER